MLTLHETNVIWRELTTRSGPALNRDEFSPSAVPVAISPWPRTQPSRLGTTPANGRAGKGWALRLFTPHCPPPPKQPGSPVKVDSLGVGAPERTACGLNENTSDTLAWDGDCDLTNTQNRSGVVGSANRWNPALMPSPYPVSKSVSAATANEQADSTTP